MRLSYINDFSKPIYKRPIGPDRQRVIEAFKPLDSPPIWANSPEGDLMTTGTSSAYPHAPGHMVYAPPSPGNEGGLALTLMSDGNTVSDPNTGPYSESRTIYLVSQNRFNSIVQGKLTVTVVFDLPNDVTNDMANNDIWSVGLVFKDGHNANEENDAQMIAVTCQFREGGAIRFHGINGIDPMTDLYPGPYTKYAANPATKFTMTVEFDIQPPKVVHQPGPLPGHHGVNVPLHPLVTGNASLTVGDDLPIQGNLTMKDPKPPGVIYSDLSFVTAVGVAITNSKNAATGTISARLHSFSLWIDTGSGGPDRLFFDPQKIEEGYPPIRASKILSNEEQS